jgi:MoaA/NifB/PqqE/SkfB family radical SAM enzyme
MKLIGKKLSVYLAAAVFRKIYIHFYWKLPRAMPIITRPHVIELEITSQCNMNCSHCHRLTLDRKTGHMDIGLFKKIVDEIASYPEAFLRIVGLGEPTIHPHFREMMRYISKKLTKVELTTNGSLFDIFSNEEILSWGIDILGVSVDGADKISYENIRRGGNYERLAKNISSFL